ncbi:hypothetical protein B0H10DRAFT_1943406 [Mycena sp. CBHHK59/15]|nr:hypothetical protein B0H10DRAFT_1943406 [Mycena sp. CBHHK59/15]
MFKKLLGACFSTQENGAYEHIINSGPDIIDIPDSPPTALSMLSALTHVPVHLLPMPMATSSKRLSGKQWLKFFPGAKYVKTTVTLWRKFWVETPLQIQQLYTSYEAVPTSIPAPFIPQPAPDLPIIPHHANPTPPTVVEANPDVVLTAEFRLCCFCDVALTTLPSAKLVHLLDESSDFIPALQDILEALDSSEFFEAAKAGSFNGQLHVLASLDIMLFSKRSPTPFPEETISADYSLLSWDTLIEQVFVLETMVSLIVEDLDLSTDEGPKSFMLVVILELPTVKSQTLVAMGEKLFELSWPDPLPDNAGHRRPFFLTTQKYYAGKATRLQSISAQFSSSDRFSQQGAGYDSPPLTYEIIIREVLIPRQPPIVQEDLDLSAEAAISVLKQSHTFGIIRQPMDDDCPFLMNAIRLITESNQCTQSAERSWKVSGTELPFHEWVQVQRELMIIKSEPVETQIMAASKMGGIIDLTLDDD